MADNHDTCRIINKEMNKLDEEFKNTAKEQSVSLGEESMSVKPEKITDTKERLEYLSNQGIRGVYELFGSGIENEKRDEFLQKHDLATCYAKHEELDRQYSENLRADNLDTCRMINKERNELKEEFKNTAKEQSVSLGEPVVEKVNRDEEFVKNLSDRNFGKLELETFDGWMPSDRTMETVQELPNLNNEEKEMIKNIYSHTTGEEALHVKGEMLNELQRDNAITDKEKLEFVAKKENGIVSLSYLFKGDNEKIDAFVEKHNLTSHYEKYNEQIKGYFEKISNGNKSLIDGELKKINDDFKIAAKEQSVKVSENVYGASYGAAYGKKETNTAKMSL